VSSNPTVRVNLSGDETDAELDRIFAVMALTPKQTYHVVASNVARLKEWADYARKFDNTDEEICDLNLKVNGDWSTPVKLSEGETIPNVHIGVHIRTQAEADAGIPALLRCPAAKWFAVVDPTEAITFRYDTDICHCGDLLKDHKAYGSCSMGVPMQDTHLHDLSFIELRGSTGPDARPVHPQWERQIRDECAEAGVEIRMNIEAKAGEA